MKELAEITPTKDSRKIHNLIQADLDSLYEEKPKPTTGEIVSWIEKYAGKFRKIMENHPEYISLYTQNRKEALDKISDELYGREFAVDK